MCLKTALGEVLVERFYICDGWNRHVGFIRNRLGYLLWIENAAISRSFDTLEELVHALHWLGEVELARPSCRAYPVPAQVREVSRVA
ncbi:MAG: hypothetical protein HQM01_13100 [Magnetococcales bacterium]|nr:hypothetical protein [Magnetococcales bacterium]